MKIVCGSCGAKYSIADEKVQGKVFKIRCKKCSNVIVVKGNSDQQSAQEEAADQGSDFGGAYGGTAGASEWYVVIDGDQVGPITPEEVEAYHASGRVTGETYAWREGLDDWSSLADLDEFAHLSASGSMPADEKTVVADQGFDQGVDAAGRGGQANEDATTVMPADDFRSQIEEKKEAESVPVSKWRLRRRRAGCREFSVWFWTGRFRTARRLRIGRVRQRRKQRSRVRRVQLRRCRRLRRRRV